MATIGELKELMLGVGISQDIVSALNPAEPLFLQGIDSLDYPAFAVAVEERYGVAISDTDTLKLKTLENFANHISERE
jgi:acyl carrier protein